MRHEGNFLLSWEGRAKRRSMNTVAQIVTHMSLVVVLPYLRSITYRNTQRAQNPQTLTGRGGVKSPSGNIIKTYFLHQGTDSTLYPRGARSEKGSPYASLQSVRPKPSHPVCLVEQTQTSSAFEA